MTREEFKQEFLKRVKDVLNGTADHFWIPLRDIGVPNRWVTGEACNEPEEDEDGNLSYYVGCYVTDGIDSFGYCWGSIILDAYPGNKDDDDEIMSYADYFYDYVEDPEHRRSCEARLRGSEKAESKEFLTSSVKSGGWT